MQFTSSPQGIISYFGDGAAQGHQLLPVKQVSLFISIGQP